MSLPAALYVHLVANCPAAGGRVYPLTLPQGTTMPALVYQQVSGGRLRSHGGSFGRPRWQIDCWASTYAEARTLAGEVESCLEAYRGAMGGEQVKISFVENEHDAYEPEARLYRVIVDVIVWN